jgi:mannose-6-phosphate isomerase
MTGATGTLAVLRRGLVNWLAEDAYPFWARAGVDPRNGGFVEAVSQDGVPSAEPRRARVQPRQTYAYAQAPRFGWPGDSAGIVKGGMDYFTSYYRRDDGLFRTLAGADGAALDERALLYDQSFALLGYAAAAVALDKLNLFEQRALNLRHRIESRFGAGDGAFLSSDADDGLRESNPHMHLLEACLDWAAVGNDPGWNTWAMSLIDLALRRFLRAQDGALCEAFMPSWQTAPGPAGHLVEPGHQFEWAWLLLRSERRHPAALRQAAFKLISIGEKHGVRNGVAVNSLSDDLSIKDANARLWPQTERLKAALRAARATGEPEFWDMAATAATSLMRYLDTPVRGLWFDLQLPDGGFAVTAAPASSFYHLVAAIAELDTALSAAPAATWNCAR